MSSFVVYVLSAGLELSGVTTIFNPTLKNLGDGTAVWLERRTGAWLIALGILIGCGGNLAALYFS